MSLEEVSAYLKITHRRHGAIRVPRSSWDISLAEQLKRGIDARKRLLPRRKDTKPEPVFEAVDNAPNPILPKPVAVDKWVYPKLVFYELDSMPVVTAKLPLYMDFPADLPQWKRIILEVCNKHHIRFNEIISNRRQVPVVRARQEAMWRMKMETTMSYPAIGRRFGGRDHTTVLHAFRQYQERIKDAEQRTDSEVGRRDGTGPLPGLDEQADASRD